MKIPTLITTAQFGRSSNREDLDLFGRPIGQARKAVKPFLGGLPPGVAAVWAQEHRDADADAQAAAAAAKQGAAEWVAQPYAQEKMIEEGLHSEDAAQLFKDRPKWMSSALHPDKENKTVNLPVLRQLMTERKADKAKKSLKKSLPLKRVNSAFDN